jgi:hypothetical protein
MKAIVDVKLMLAYNNAMSTKKKLFVIIETVVINNTTCVEKLLNAVILSYILLVLDTIRHNIILIQSNNM